MRRTAEDKQTCEMDERGIVRGDTWVPVNGGDLAPSLEGTEKFFAVKDF